jgi:tetratricopeptide (TPR) repeat protein
MNIVYLELKPRDEQFTELRYRVPEQIQYQSRTLPLAEIAGLYDFADTDFARNSPDLAKIGRQLFDWLDGTERWLSRSIEQQPHGLILAIDCQDRLGGLPWEVLYYEGFLVARSIVPIRIVGGFQRQPVNREPSKYQLQTLFMATDPIDVTPKLAFEAEEALILDATRDLAMELRVEESGCLEELKNFWGRFKGRFDIFHLSGHANIRDGVPYFITESLEGERVDASIQDFADAFKLRYPPLMFLSGCRTGESGKRGGAASLAAGLVAQGAPAILGWGRPVTDDGAIMAAMALYRALAEGYTLAEALALTYQELIGANVPDWCLLRLYAELGAWEALVLPVEDRLFQSPPEANTEFLDPQGLIKVAGKDGFVGRRRYLQRGLKALKSPQNLGIWLYGLGGAGKSTIACRLLDRLSASDRKLVITGTFDRVKLENLLSPLCNSTGKQILLSDLLLAEKLVKVFKNGLDEPEQRLVFVLDDFEQNIESAGDGKPVLKAEVVEPLTALFAGISKSNIQHRVIVTSQYDVTLPSFDRKVERFQVERMDKADVKKLSDRLESFAPDSTVPGELQARAQQIADGYPRLLEALDKMLKNTPETDSAAILAAMSGEKQEFMAKVLAAKLIAQQEPELQQMLVRGAMFELPVPLVVLQSICTDLAGFARHVDRSKALGLLETGLSADLVRVPRVLDLEPPADLNELAAIGVKVLHQQWIEQAEFSNEAQQLELHRLAMLGGDGEIAVDMAKRLSDSWIAVSRYGAARNICEETLALQTDGSLIYNLSKIYQTLGDLQKALDYAQQSIEIYRKVRDRQGESSSLHQLSMIYKDLGELRKALSFSEQAIKIKIEIGDRCGEASSLHQLSIIYRNLGQLEQALSFVSRAIRIDKETDNRQGEAASLQQLSIIYYSLGEIQQSLSHSEEAIEIEKEVGDRRGEAGSYNQLSIIYYSLEELEKAISFSEKAIKINREVGDRGGEATSLHQLSIIYNKSGDLYRAFSLSQQSIKIVREIGDRKGEAVCLSNMAYYAGQLNDTDKEQELYMKAAILMGTIYDYCNLITVLGNLGINDKPEALNYLAQSLWLTLQLLPNLKSTVDLIESMYDRVTIHDSLKSLLGATACHLCQTRSHPELEQLIKRSNKIIRRAASQQGIETQADFDKWKSTNRLDDPDYFLPELRTGLAAIVGDGWLFDRSVFDRAKE